MRPRVWSEVDTSTVICPQYRQNHTAVTRSEGMSDDDSSESLWGTDTASDHGGEESSTGWDTDEADSAWHTDDRAGESTESRDPDATGSDDGTDQDRRRAEMYAFIMWALIAVVMGYALVVLRQVLLAVAAGSAIYLLFRLATPD
jgi:hypothetical protein